MEIITFVIIFILGRFVAGGLFNNPEWRTNAQNKFDSIKRERAFWSLINAKMTLNGKVIEHSIEDVFKSYLFTGSSSFNGTIEDITVKRMLGKDDVSNLNILNDKIRENDKIIEGLLEKNQITFSKNEIRELFEKVTEFGEPLKGSDGYNLIFDCLDFGKEEASGLAVWNRTKDFSFHYDNAYFAGKEDFRGTIVQIRFKGVKLSKEVRKLLCEGIRDKERSKELMIALTERNKLELLSWCIRDFSNEWNPSTILQRFLWRVAEVILL